MSSCAISHAGGLENIYDKFPQHGGREVQVSRKIQNNLYYIYKDLPKELTFCLTGEQNKSVIKVSDLAMPPIFDNSEHGVSYMLAYCHDLPNYIGVAHNHPNGMCDTSEMDDISFMEDDKAVVELIVCGFEPNKTARTYMRQKSVDKE